MAQWWIGGLELKVHGGAFGVVGGQVVQRPAVKEMSTLALSFGVFKPPEPAGATVVHFGCFAAGPRDALGFLVRLIAPLVFMPLNDL